MSEQTLRQRIAEARKRAARGGSMHPLWDSIFEAEAFLDGRETLLTYSGPREKTIEKLISDLS